MNIPIVKFATAPTLIFNAPDCDACSVSVEHDGDGWRCPTCGTTWAYNTGEDEPGTLYEDWSGEVLDIEVTDPLAAWQVTINADRARREQERAEQNARALVVRAERAGERTGAADERLHAN